ncbi:hypothetical protein JD844_000660 [Phrynosoma platyrhinos]|uniref:Uncharacterized protein n=1 Tax=Phrynosoma platyrhinos TaxID=52577 RepID=A0ABQ7SQS3_PHRPL|nr:hypothetical protein JD844_000660 [Phrynosoma platyrhinos]
MAAAASSSSSEPAVKPLQGAMKLAKGALELDAGDRPREAYVEGTTFSFPFSSVADGNDVMPDTPKMLKVAEQCLERAKSSIAKIGKAKTKLAAERILGPAPISRHRRVFSDEGGKLLPFLPPEMFQKLQITEVQSAKKELTPLEEASLQNQKLRATYEARLARLNPSQAMQKTSLASGAWLEKVGLPKWKDRVDGFCGCGLFVGVGTEMGSSGSMVAVRTLTLLYPSFSGRWRNAVCGCKKLPTGKRFSSNAVLTPEEQEQRAIYAAILEYEQDHDWPRSWKIQLKKSPNDLSLVPKLISHLLSFSDHPICQLLKKLQCSVYSRVYPLVSRSAADFRVSGKVSRGLSLSSSLDGEPFLSSAPEGRRLRSSQSLHSMFSVQENNKLNLRHSLSSTPFIEDQTLSGPERGGPVEPSLPEQEAAHTLPDRESSFEDLEQFLSASERNVYKTREAALSRSMELHRNIPPSDFGISSKLLPQSNSAKRPGSYPYCTAVQELMLIPLGSCPQKKLECIGEMEGRLGALGADLACYLYLIGEEGYCLTSLQSAISYVESLHRPIMEK